MEKKVFSPSQLHRAFYVTLFNQVFRRLHVACYAAHLLIFLCVRSNFPAHCRLCRVPYIKALLPSICYKFQLRKLPPKIYFNFGQNPAIFFFFCRFSLIFNVPLFDNASVVASATLHAKISSWEKRKSARTGYLVASQSKDFINHQPNDLWPIIK